ncbi:hypothetical protein [Jeotgalibaca sp. A122]|uniref:hypothetical protein n=1 Tax=Jeotgalibaca sp. A122 TaxID=3457322 RepID=UPI003FD496BB
MAFTVFKETWLHLLRNTKNRLTIVLVLVAILTYSAFFLPRLDGFNIIDLKQLEQSIVSNEGIMKSAIEDGNFDVNMFTGKSAYVDAKQKYENNRALLAAIENGDALRYRVLTDVYLPDFHYEDMQDRYATNSLFPMKDFGYDLTNYGNRVGSYDTSELSFHVIQEKTAWQQIHLFMHEWGPAILVILTLFIGADVFVESIQKRTQRIGIPIDWGKYLLMQSLAIFSFVLIFFLVAGGIFFILNGLLFGFGSLQWQVPSFTYSDDPILMLEADGLIPISGFLLKTLPFLLMILYLFIRLTVLFSLVFRQSVIVFIAGIFTLLFEKLYFNRTTRDIFGIDISKFPQTYFDFGKVISGEKNFLLNTGTIAVEQGLLILAITIVTVEILLAVMVSVRNRQRFIG